MSRHLFAPDHLPHPHIAGQLAEFAHHLLSGRWHEPPVRKVPASADWPEWHWDREGR